MNCPKCGEELVNNKCPKCGIKILFDDEPQEDVVFFGNNGTDDSVIDLTNDPEAAKRAVRQAPSSNSQSSIYGIIGFICIVVLVVFIFRGCGSSSKSDTKRGNNEISPPLSSYDCEGKNYNDVKKLFSDAGFTNITEVAVEDLKIGLLASEDEVESISIGGDSSFSTKDAFPKDDLVVISYHAYPGASKKKETETSIVEKTVPSADEIAVPLSSKECEKKNYKDIESKFKDAGFTNITTEKLEDMIIGFLVSEGDVDEISVDGNKSFSKGDYFSKSAQVKIIYHAYPEDKTETTTTTTTKAETAASKTTAKQTTEVPKQQSGNLTIDNNQDWAYVFTHDLDPSEYKAFVNKYKGSIVEFDGNIAYMDFHENYNTRFDYLIYPGNYSDTSPAPGIHMRIENANYYDLHLTGANVPSSITMGLNIHVVAKIVEFNRGELMVIKPVSISVR